MTVTSELVAVCRNLYREKAATDVLTAARRCLIDSIAAGFSAVGEQSIGILTETTGSPVEGAAGATVLGGETVVGEDSVIGGNVFLTNSVPAGSIVYQTSQFRVRRAHDGFEDADFVI